MVRIFGAALVAGALVAFTSTASAVTFPVEASGTLSGSLGGGVGWATNFDVTFYSDGTWQQVFGVNGEWRASQADSTLRMIDADGTWYRGELVGGCYEGQWIDVAGETGDWDLCL